VDRESFRISWRVIELLNAEYRAAVISPIESTVNRLFISFVTTVCGGEGLHTCWVAVDNYICCLAGGTLGQAEDLARDGTGHIPVGRPRARIQSN
jgi:hypothetical protein